MYIVACYLTYLAFSVAVTIYVGATLHRNGRVFLVSAFHGAQDLADSVNKLLLVGFYLVNIGYIALALETQTRVETLQAAIELVCNKLGVALLVLGLMHFFNLYVLNRLRKRATEPLRRPAPAPDHILD